MEFNGIVAPVAEANTKVIQLNGEEVEKIRLRVVSESGRAKPVEQDDGSTRKERKKSYFDVEAWGGQARALQALHVGEKVHLSGDIIGAEPFEKADGTTFYPDPTMRVNRVEFIGANPAASKDRALKAMQAANDEVVNQSMDADLGPGSEAAESNAIGF